jgi:Clostridium epsilon toxin ETX/Bacillus mosquitocidal toxin MTX2
MNNHSKTKLFLLTSLFAATAQAQVPVGNWLKTETVKSVLTNGWQRSLDTDKDPSNRGEWDRVQARDGNPVGGLFGGLQETQLTTEFDTPRRYPVQYVSKKRVEVKNGTDSPTSSAINLEYTDSRSVADSSSTSESVKTGAEISFKVSASAFGMGAESGGKFSEDFTRTSGTSNTTTTVRQEKFSNTLTIVVPPRKTYVVTLSCEEEKVDLPYRSSVRLSGMSHTWFPSRVNGHFNWNQDVGGVVAHSNSLPRDWRLPGDGTVLVSAAQGVLTAQQSTNCNAVTTDITEVLNKNVASLAVARGRSITDFVQPGGALVSVTPMRR